MYRSNAETIYELSTFPRFYPLLTTAQTFEITALSSRRALKMFLSWKHKVPYFQGLNGQGVGVVKE